MVRLTGDLQPTHGWRGMRPQDERSRNARSGAARSNLIKKKGFSMLVITRKINETVRIGDAVVTVTKIKGGQVTIGIEAPPEVKVLRAELEEKEAKDD